MTPKRGDNADHLATSEPKQQHGGEFPIFCVGICQPKKPMEPDTRCPNKCLLSLAKG